MVDDRTITDAGHAQQDLWPLVRAQLPIHPFGGEAAAHHGGSEGLELADITVQDQLTAWFTNRLHAQGERADQGEAAPAAAEQAHQVIARHVFHDPAARTGAHSIAADQADANDLVAHA